MWLPVGPLLGCCALSQAELGCVWVQMILRERCEYGVFSHESKSSNYEAHNLAKHALSLGVSRHVWLGHPGNLPSVPINIVTN